MDCPSSPPATALPLPMGGPEGRFCDTTDVSVRSLQVPGKCDTSGRVLACEHAVASEKSPVQVSSVTGALKKINVDSPTLVCGGGQLQRSQLARGALMKKLVDRTSALPPHPFPVSGLVTSRGRLMVQAEDSSQGSAARREGSILHSHVHFRFRAVGATTQSQLLSLVQKPKLPTKLLAVQCKIMINAFYFNSLTLVTANT